jgi:hypothetical protein
LDFFRLFREIPSRLAETRQDAAFALRMKSMPEMVNSSLKWSAALCFFLLCAASGFAQSATRSRCEPSFPFAQGWLGADAAYSVPFADGRDLWIFGDTLYGDERKVSADEPTMVRNTVGISTCKDGHWRLDYTIRRDAQGKPLDFFQSQHKGTWYWALDGVVQDDDLWVTLLCVRNSPKTTSAALGFEICGSDLAHLTGLRGDPQDWKVSYLPLVPDGVHANPSASTVIEGDHVYLFTLDENGKRPEILTRIPVKGLDDPARNLQYLDAAGQWQSGLEPAKAKAVMEHGASEMTVRYHPELKSWIALLVDPNIFSSKVLLRTSPSLAGPWTDGEVIYKIPEMQKDSSGYDADTFCYAGKEHPEFEDKGELVFTYVCNTLKPQKLVKELNIYFPKVVRMKMPITGKGQE